MIGTPTKGKPGPLARGLLLYRRELGLSQDAFAERCSIGPATVKRYELGTAAPSDSTLATVAHAFALKPSELLLKCARLVVGEEKRSPCPSCGAMPDPITGKREHVAVCSRQDF